MAPRGRPRKRSTRMDAAIDAMRNLGFDEEVVTRTVKELLDIYGEDGWPFIEEYGYKELIDAILRGSETSKDEIMEENDCTQIEVANARAEDVAGSSNTASGQICSEIGDFAPEAESTMVKLLFSSACNTVKNTENRGGTPLANEDINGWKEIGEHRSNQIAWTQKERCNDICNSRGNPEAAINSQSACAVSALLVASPQTTSIQKDKSHDLYNTSRNQRCNDICNSRGNPEAAINSQNACAVSALLVPSSQTPSIQKDKSHDLCNTSGNPGREMNSQSAPAVRFSPLTLSQTPVPQPVTPHSSRRRFPCYGWIDSDEEQEVADLIYLPPVEPAKRPTRSAKNNRGTNKVKHQSKWDVRPENL